MVPTAFPNLSSLHVTFETCTRSVDGAVSRWARRSLQLTLLTFGHHFSLRNHTIYDSSGKAQSICPYVQYTVPLSLFTLSTVNHLPRATNAMAVSLEHTLCFTPTMLLLHWLSTPPILVFVQTCIRTFDWFFQNNSPLEATPRAI